MSTRKYTKIKKELRNKYALEQCAKEFGVIGDETRLKICYLLCRYPELSVSDISKFTNVSMSTVSHSLARLKEINLVSRRRQAQTIYYSLKKSSLSHLLKNYLALNI